MRGRRSLAMVMALAGAVLLAAAPAAQEEVRTEADLLGFDLKAEAAPLSIRFFEDFIPIPTDPGDPQFELTASYSAATLGTGPLGRAVASSIWPGPAFGDGFGTIVGDEEEEYPVRAAARYPGRSEEDWQAARTIEGVDNFGMFAEARGLDITARSEGGGLPGPVEPVAAFGQIRSEATNTVTGSEATATSLSSISELALLEGVIVLHDVTTEMTATSNGQTATTDGRTNVGAIEILGQRARLTGDGIQLVPADDGGDDEDDPLGQIGAVLEPVNQAIRQLTSDLVADGVEETLGIHIAALDQQETLNGAIGRRTASGVKITINLAVLRDALQPIIDLVPLGDVLDLVPDDENTGQLKGLLFELLGLGTKMEVIVGRGLVATSASPPFELPALPPPPPPPPPAAGSTAPVGQGISVPPPTDAGAGVPPADVAPPAVSSPEAQPPALAATELPDLFDGIPLALVGVLLLLTAVPTYGLTTIREAAVGPTANVEPPRQLPDLRGGT